MMRIGIDAGGSLIKIAYEEDEKLHVKKYAMNESSKLCQWLNVVAPQATLIGTGGNWSRLKTMTNHENHTVDEFIALVNGTRYLLQIENKRMDSFILTSIGTGTSIFYVDKHHFERVLGSGIGGGTWMGLGSIITKENSFHKLVKLASMGNRENNDLLVKDIYGMHNEAPLLEHLTAANFGKVHINIEGTEVDHAAALNQLIGEVILTLASHVAQNKKVKQIVFIGSTIQDNKPLQQVLTEFQEMLSLEFIFLEKGAYAGAIGALFD